MLEGSSTAAAQLAVVVRLRDADRRAEPRGLDEHRDSRTGSAARRRRAACTLRVTGIPLSRITALNRSLSMQSAEAATPAPTYGHAGELEQPLHRPVLAERPVQHREHDVDVAERRRRRSGRRRARAAPLLGSGASPRRARGGVAEPGSSAQRPSRSISTVTTSYAPAERLGTERARREGDSCSLDRPPVTTAIRRRQRRHGGVVVGGVGRGSSSVVVVGRRRRSASSARSRSGVATSRRR